MYRCWFPSSSVQSRSDATLSKSLTANELRYQRIATLRKHRRKSISLGIFAVLCLVWSFTHTAIAQDDVNFEPHIMTARGLAELEVTEEVRRHKKIREYRVVILEGNSWFDLPSPHADLAQAIEDLDYGVMSVAERGDTLENMAFNGQLVQIAIQFRTLAHYNKRPVAILLSGGGNEIVGPNLQFILNHHKSTMGSSDQQRESRWSESILNGALVRYQSYMFDYIAAVSFLCETLAQDEELKLSKIDCNNIPIVIHGYDYPLSSGKGFKYLWLFRLEGPWLEPSFDAKAYSQQSANNILRELVNAFNESLLEAVKVLNESNAILNPVSYLDLSVWPEKS